MSNRKPISPSDMFFRCGWMQATIRQSQCKRNRYDPEQERCTVCPIYGRVQRGDEVELMTLDEILAGKRPKAAYVPDKIYVSKNVKKSIKEQILAILEESEGMNTTQIAMRTTTSEHHVIQVAKKLLDSGQINLQKQRSNKAATTRNLYKLVE